ncbi:Chk1 protein kinase [Pichia californica]|uniref:non-specific serine/threonine protein kinase n=1 Tax=Pichia californica TaxID=460514 RepID=A0A9P6WQE6_9ASCO|nr:Chk1 protein kinase [[Candida] californica]
MSETYNLSQMAPLPHIRRVVMGKTIGHGGFALVKCAQTATGKPPFVAVKLMYLPFAKEKGVNIEKIAREAIIQKSLVHKNIIRMFDFSYDDNWAWIALELAESGELFDKIEPDIGVDQDVAHFYFTQLINAVEFMHSMGVAHRDIKPENLVLDKYSNLKLTDFGLACVFKKKTGPKRQVTGACGSPPYAAPEIIQDSYDPAPCDIWSCGIVLFVLLTGKIAWEMPVISDKDFAYFIEHKGEILISPWNKLDFGALSLLRKILVPNVDDRITIKLLKENRWFRKDRGLLNENGMCKDPAKLGARLLVNLYINMSDGEFSKVTEYSATQRSNNRRKLETQPEKHIVDDLDNDFNKLFSDVYSASQQPYTERTKRQKLKSSKDFKHQRELELIAMDPATLQFYRDEKGISKEMRQKIIDQQINMRTEQIRKHPELYADSFTRFFSFSLLEDIVILLTESLVQLNVIDSEEDIQFQNITQQLKENGSYQGVLRFQINFTDDYNMPLNGEIVLSKVADNLEARKLDFIRQSGDPLEWRRFFKRVTILCRDIVYYPEH